MTIRRASLRAAWALAIGLLPSLAKGQDASDLAARRGLIEQAQQARTANNHQQALDLAMRATQIQMSPSLRLFVAQEQNSLGRLADAFGNADTCMREAEADQTLHNRTQVVETCRTLAQDVRRRVGQVTVHTPSPAPSDLAVTVAGNALRSSLWGVAYMVAPGHVAVDASASGYAAFHTEVDVTAGHNMDVTVTLTQQSGGSGSSSNHHEAAHNNNTAQSSTSSGSTASGGNSNHNNNGSNQQSAAGGGGGGGGSILPLIVIIGGVLVAGASAIFWVFDVQDLNQLETICPNGACPSPIPPMAQTDHDQAQTWAIVGGVLDGVGGAALIAGIVLLALRPSHPSSSAAFLDVTPMPGGAMLGLHGSF